MSCCLVLCGRTAADTGCLGRGGLSGLAWSIGVLWEIWLILSNVLACQVRFRWCLTLVGNAFEGKQVKAVDREDLCRRRQPQSRGRPAEWRGRPAIALAATLSPKLYSFCVCEAATRKGKTSREKNELYSLFLIKKGHGNLLWRKTIDVPVAAPRRETSFTA